MKDISINIKQLRKEKGLTQLELAKAVGYTDRSMIAKIENGSVDLPQDRIEAFAKALDTTPAALAGWVEPMDKLVQSVQYHADMIAHILGYDLGGDPAEGLVTLTFDGVDREITLARWELYEKGLILYAKHLLNEIYEDGGS